MVLFVPLAFFSFSFFSSHQLYSLHEEVSLHKNTATDSRLPASVIKMIGSWHDISYADAKWMEVIQFIGESFGASGAMDSMRDIFRYITSISPAFSHAYEIDLLLTPIVPENATGTAHEIALSRVKKAMDHAENGMQLLCDTEKITKILAIDSLPDLWKDISLENPCVSGMVPYYLWMHSIFSLGDGNQASKYYKIASMNTDAPEASKYLVLLAKTYAGNPFDSAISSLLVWAGWYDKEPYVCLNATKDVLSMIHKPEDMTSEFLDRLEKIEKWLKDTHSSNIPESNSATNCFDSFKRATKSFYIAYVTEQWKNYPKVTDAQDFVKLWIMTHIPTIQGQEWYKLLRRWSVWNFFKQ